MTDLKTNIETISAAAARDRSLYEIDPIRDGYRLTAGGRQLARVRAALKDNPGLPQLPTPAAGKAPVLKKVDWMTALSCAEPKERKILLARCAAGHIAVKD